MDIAETVSKQSSAIKLQVGAVAVKNDRIISIGYNGTSPGSNNTCEDKIYYQNDGEDYPHYDEFGHFRYKTRPSVIHAEMNLIYKLARDGESGKDATLFVTTAPCYECAKAILSVGFNSVFYRQQYRSTDGINELVEKGVKVEQL
jgi:dCMP deaminase